MKRRSRSRRTFLKTTVAGGTAALGGLPGIAGAADGSHRSDPSPGGVPGEAPIESRSSGVGTPCTRGVGVYPGDPAEGFAPTVVAGHSNNYRAIRELPKANLEITTVVQKQGDRWLLKTELHNPAPHPALMVRLRAVREKTADRILPAF